ncbi:MAG: hypothetical protein U1F07_16440 [Rubrivivax sp.]
MSSTKSCAACARRASRCACSAARRASAACDRARGGLPQRRRDAAQQRRHHQRRGAGADRQHEGRRHGGRNAQCDAVAAQPPPAARQRALAPRPDWRAGEEAAPVLRQRVDRGVALGHGPAQGLGEDGVEVAAQRAAARRLGGQGARRRRLVARAGLRGRRPLAAQQLTGHHAERVDVAGRADRLAAQLLGAGVLRR